MSRTKRLRTLARWRAAFPALDALIAAGAAPGAALRRLGLTFWSAGETVAAAEALGEAAIWAPGDAAIWLDLGFARRAAQDGRGALEAFEQAVAARARKRARLARARAWRRARSGAAPRAEAALDKALALDPALDEAAYALGLICFDARRYAEAARHWRGVVARGFSAPGLWLGLGQCQFFLGEFGRRRAIARPAISKPRPATKRWRAGWRWSPSSTARFAAVPTAAAPPMRRWRRPAPPVAAVAKTAVQLLVGLWLCSTALAVARAFLGEDADDPIQRHHLAALAGETVARAPADYVAAYFDRFADTFDAQMFEVLHYCGPRKLCALLAETGAPVGRTLDLGCGTGAAGPLLRPRATQLVGVDLSQKMLAKARRAAVYDELARADMVEYLEARARGVRS